MSVATPDATAPDATAPDATAPDATAPGTTVSDATASNAAASEAVASEATASAATMPERSAAGGGRGIPLYQMVKRHILELIDLEGLEQGNRLPSESELVEALGVSRMTVNRALRELSGDGVIERVSGVGTFVAQRRFQSHPLEIRDIAAEVAERGHVHHSEVVELGATRASPAVALHFGVAAGTRLFQSVILHRESGVPIQLERRHVHPGFAPHYLEQDFSVQTPTEYLLSQSSAIDEVEQVVQAALPETATAGLLEMPAEEPCLVLCRRTWVQHRVVTRAVLYHPASRYQFGSRYRP